MGVKWVLGGARLPGGPPPSAKGADRLPIPRPSPTPQNAPSRRPLMRHRLAVLRNKDHREDLRNSFQKEMNAGSITARQALAPPMKAHTPSRQLDHGSVLHDANGLANSEASAFFDVLQFADSYQGAAVPGLAKGGKDVWACFSI